MTQDHVDALRSERPQGILRAWPLTEHGSLDDSCGLRLGVLADALDESGWPNPEFTSVMRTCGPEFARNFNHCIKAVSNYALECLRDVAGGVPRELAGEDWWLAIKVGGQTPEPADIGFTDLNPFTRTDVVEVIAMSDGEQDGEDWLVLGKLHDGRYFFVSSGWRYSGLDGGWNGISSVGTAMEDVIVMGMGDEDRRRLGLEQFVTIK